MPVAARPQPFRYHPLPGLAGPKVLAADNKLLSSVDQDAGDSLLVPPTPVSPNGLTERFLFTVVARVTEQPQSEGPSPLSEGDVQLVVKTVDGREAVVGQNSGGENVDDNIDLASFALVLNEETDLGYFVRINAADTAVDVLGPFYDMRGMDGVVADVVDVFPNKTLLYANNEFGRTEVHSAFEIFAGLALVQNFDDINHLVRFFLSDGTNTIEITRNTPSATDAGTVDDAQIGEGIPPIPQGWSLYAALDTDGVSTKAPRVIIAMQPTNAAARSDQAGAF